MGSNPIARSIIEHNLRALGKYQIAVFYRVSISNYKISFLNISPHGMLVKRPLLVDDGFILAGLEEAEWRKAVKGSE